MIEFRDVTLQYHYEQYPLLKGVSFTLSDGINTVLADTQSGKSSLCKLLTKDVKPTGGEIFVDGLPLKSITNAHLGILYLPSSPTFFGNRSVRYNIEYPLRVRKVSKAERRAKVEQIAARLNIHCLDVKLATLSVKERKLIALARGLTVERKVVLFDDFFQTDGWESTDRIDGVLEMFANATCVILTSDKSQALGNTVVLDGGVTAYVGDAAGAVEVINGLQWLNDSIKE